MKLIFSQKIILINKSKIKIIFSLLKLNIFSEIYKESYENKIGEGCTNLFSILNLQFCR